MRTRFLTTLAFSVLGAGCASAQTLGDVRAGWYTAPGDRHVLVSPAPGDGFRRLDFENADFGALDLGEGADAFRWVGPASGGPALESPNGERWTPWPDAPYRLEEVAFLSPDGATLEGLLLLPRAPVSRGAVVLHGSGSSDRDNVWAYTFAHALAEGGVAVLFADKRGSGGSTGDWRAVGFDALARDAVVAAEELGRRAGLPPDSIGWVGLSQGGWIAPLAARLSGRGAFVVGVSSAAVPVFDQIAFEVANTMRTEGFSAEAVASALELQATLERHALGSVEWEVYREARERVLGGPGAPFAEAMPDRPDDWRWAWWARVGAYDPVESWARADRPTLVIYGEEDEADNVPVRESVRRLEALRRRPGVGGDVSVDVFPGLGHALVDPDTGWVSPEVLERLVGFVRGAGPD